MHVNIIRGWANMAQSWSKVFYQSKAWRECRAGYIMTVQGLCERCRGLGYIVHHKTTLTEDNINDPMITLNWGQLEYLCLTCHNKVNTVDDIRQGLSFNDKGELIEDIIW